MTRRTRALVLLLLVFLAFLAVRVPLLSRQGLWADEYFSMAMATGHGLEHPAAAADPALGDFAEPPGAVPAAALARLLAHDDPPATASRVLRAIRLSDTSPPLYYLLLWGWTRAFGTSDVALRAFSLLAALAAFPLVALLARRTGGPAAVLPACVLYALLPTSIWLATEGRMYALLVLEAAGLAALSLELARRDVDRRTGWRAAAWILVAAAGLLTHYAFLFVFAAMVVTCAWRPGRFGRGRLALAVVAVALLMAPWYVGLPASGSAWRVTDYWLKMPPAEFDRSTAILNLPWNLLSNRGAAGVSTREELLHGALLLGVVALATWRLRARWFAPRTRLAWLWLGAACAGPVVLDALQGTYMVAVPRYVVAGLPAAIVLVAAAFAALSRLQRLLALLAVAATCSLAARRAFAAHDRSGQPFHQLGTQLAESLGPDDLLVVHSIPSGVVGLARELVRAGERGAKVAVLTWVAQLGTRTPEQLAAAARGRRRVVHLSVHEVGTSSTALEWLQEHGRRGRGFRNASARVQFFEPAEGDRF